MASCFFRSGNWSNRRTRIWWFKRAIATATRRAYPRTFVAITTQSGSKRSSETNPLLVHYYINHTFCCLPSFWQGEKTSQRAARPTFTPVPSVANHEFGSIGSILLALRFPSIGSTSSHRDRSGGLTTLVPKSLVLTICHNETHLPTVTRSWPKP